MKTAYARTGIRNTKDESIFNAVNICFLLALSVLFLYPIVYVISASISKPIHLMSGDVVLLPKELTFDSYREAFTIPNFWRSYWNSVHLTAVGTLINMFFTVTGAYVLSNEIKNGSGAVLSADSGTGTVHLVYAEKYRPGDTISLSVSDPGCFLVIQFDSCLNPAFVYMKERTYTFEIPFEEKRFSYDPKTFSGNLHLLKAR